MNYNTIEKSLVERTPIRLYKFKRGALTWAYNSSAEDIKRNNILYKSVAGGVSDQGIIISDGGTSDNFKVLAPADIDIVKQFYGIPPSARIELEVANTHFQTQDIKPVWWGIIISITERSINQVEIIASPNESIANRPGVTLVYSRQCGAVIYDGQCKVDKELYRVRANIQQITASGIEVNEAAKYQDGWFSGGFIEYTIEGGEIERRYIEQHVGTQLVLWGGSQGIKQSQTISLFAGCDTNPMTCKNKFNNQLNRQSFDHLKGSSPFDGNQVF